MAKLASFSDRERLMPFKLSFDFAANLQDWNSSQDVFLLHRIRACICCPLLYFLQLPIPLVRLLFICSFCSSVRSPHSSSLSKA